MRRTIRLGSEEIDLDSTDLEFNEATLGDFQERLAIKYDYFGQKLADLEYVKDCLEGEMEEIHARVYLEHKDEGGCTEKQADSRAKSDIAYVSKKKEVSRAKKDVKTMANHLRAWDRAHDNAASRGHTLRREMNKLGGGVDYGVRTQRAEDLGAAAEEIIGGGQE